MFVQSPDPEMNARAISALADVMQLERSALSRIDMQMNALAPADAMLLMPALSPVTVSSSVRFYCKTILQYILICLNPSR